MTRKKILAVDDSSIVRKIIKNSVDALYFDLLEASDGTDALDVLEKQHENIQLILLDWNMPGMNGFDFLLNVKSNRFYKNIPVMMITTEGEKGNIIKAIQAGVNNYLLKPFKTNELTKKITETLGKVTGTSYEE